MSTKSNSQSNSIKIPPFHYIHVLDNNTNITAVHTGPQTFIRQEHQEITSGSQPLKMIVLPQRHYCQIQNPVLLSNDGAILKDKYGSY